MNKLKRIVCFFFGHKESDWERERAGSGQLTGYRVKHCLRCSQELERWKPKGTAAFKRAKPKRAVNQDVGKFMKHGRQAPWYRKSVKAKKNLRQF